MVRSFCVPRKRAAPDHAPVQSVVGQENAPPSTIITQSECKCHERKNIPLGVSAVQKESEGEDKAFKTLYAKRSNKRRKNKCWTGMSHVPSDCIVVNQLCVLKRDQLQTDSFWFDQLTVDFKSGSSATRAKKFSRACKRRISVLTTSYRY